MALTAAQIERREALREYWRKREREQRELYLLEEEEQQRRINQIYSGMEAWCTQEIEAFYGRYATAEGIDITEAKKRVSQADIEQYEALAKQYVKDRDFSDEANQAMRLYNATMKINRLELLKAQIGLHMVGGTDEIAKYYEETITNRTMDELERQSGILGKPLKEEDVLKKAKNIVNASFYNATFSERIWSHCDNLRNEIGIELQKGLIAGVGSRQMAANLRKKYQASASDAHRLMVTELRRVQTDVALDSYKENGIEEFEFLAVNPRACEICKEMDGKVFPVSELEAGVNAPPIHPRCHCTTAPHMDEDEYNAWLTTLENGGTSAFFEAFKDELVDEYKANKKERREAERIITEEVGLTIDDSVRVLPDNVLVEQANQLKALEEKFGIVHRSTDRVLIAEDDDGAQAFVRSLIMYPASQRLSLCPHTFFSLDNLKETYRDGRIRQIFMPAKDEYAGRYAVTHEYGHMLHNVLFSERAADFTSFPTRARSHKAREDAYEKYRVNFVRDMNNEIIDIARQKNPSIDPSELISEYGMKNPKEWFAEVFANSQCGKPNELGEAMNEWLRRQGF